MPSTPHIVTTTVYDTDNSSKKEGARVYIRNCTKHSTSAEAITDSNGVVEIDLANLPLTAGQTVPYETGDKVLIIAYHGNVSDGALYTVTGNSKAQTLYLTHVRHIKGLVGERVRTLIAANTNGSTAYNAKLYALDDGQILAQVQMAANATVVVPFHGVSASGGIVIERSNKDVVVTAEIK